jgi:hypothetical protein
MEERKAEKERRKLERKQQKEEEELKAGTTPAEESAEVQKEAAGESGESPTDPGSSPTEGGKRTKKVREPREKREKKPREKYVFKRKDGQTVGGDAAASETGAPSQGSAVFATPVEPSAAHATAEEDDQKETDELLRKAVNASSEETSASPVKPEPVKEATPVKEPVPEISKV